MRRATPSPDAAARRGEGGRPIWYRDRVLRRPRRPSSMNSLQPAERRDASGSADDVRARAGGMLWAVLDGTALAPGAAFFPALVHHLAKALDVAYVFLAECTDQTRTRVRTLAFWSRDALVDHVEFDLVGTPCEAVIGGAVRCHAEAL